MSSGYDCLREPLEDGSGYRMRSLAAGDMERIRRWRNAQIPILRQREPISEEEQAVYFRDVVVPTFGERHPDQVLVAWDYDGELIGYGGLVHIDWSVPRAEVSFLEDPDRVLDRALYRRDFLAFLGLLAKLAFERLEMERLVTECYDLRPWHVAVIEEAGFVPEGRLRSHVRKEGRLVDSLIHGLLREDWQS